MNDPRHPLTAEVQELICNYVRAGVSPDVAAVAAGIPVKVFETWMRWGKARRPIHKYRDFREAIEQAQALAQVAADCRTLLEAPLLWLCFGPGCETGTRPDWNEGVAGTNEPVSERQATGTLEVATDHQAATAVQATGNESAAKPQGATSAGREGVQ